MYILFTSRKKRLHIVLIWPENVFLVSSFIMHSNVFREVQRNSQIFSRNPHKHKQCLHLRSYPLEHRHHLPRHRVAAWQKRRTTWTADSSPLHRPPNLTPPSTSQIPQLERFQLRSNLHYSSEEHIYLEFAVIEAAGPKLTFSSQKESSPRSRTLSGGFLLISGLSRGGCVCVFICAGFCRALLGGRWCLADGESAGFSVWVICQQWV